MHFSNGFEFLTERGRAKGGGARLNGREAECSCVKFLPMEVIRLSRMISSSSESIKICFVYYTFIDHLLFFYKIHANT